jgi:Spy/CpxP family protein refolding chaperone
MRTVKPFSLLAALFLMAPVLAQGRYPASASSGLSGQRRDLQRELEKELKLTEKQRQEWAVIIGRYRPKVKTVQDKYAPKLVALRKQMQTMSTQMTQELKPTLDARRKELERVLTPEQRKKKQTLDAALKVAIQRRLVPGNRKP